MMHFEGLNFEFLFVVRWKSKPIHRLIFLFSPIKITLYGEATDFKRHSERDSYIILN